jgi:hypothetical protein
MRGGPDPITASIKSAAASTALIGCEVYNAAGLKVLRQFWHTQFYAGQPCPCTSSTWVRTYNDDDRRVRGQDRRLFTRWMGHPPCFE